MADVTIPTIPGGVANPAQVEQNFYRPTGAGTTSCEIINGHLDNANRNPAWKINRSHIQRGVLSTGETEGGTLGLDYFGDLFPSWNITEDTQGHAQQLRMDELYQVIPGASITFYVPYPVSFVALSWHIQASADQRDKVDTASHPPNYVPARIRLFYDGVRVPRKLLDVPAKNWRNNDMLGEWDRSWLGHHVVTTGSAIAKGWHSASLRIAVDPGYNSATGADLYFPHESCHTHCRVRVRSMDYVLFH